MQLSNASGSLHGPFLIMRVWRPQTEIATFQAGGETQWYDFNFNAIALRLGCSAIECLFFRSLSE